MVSSFDKYFQIAPCFRDEDARADRSPGEFYQLDFEMSFVEQDDVLNEIEPVLYEIFSEFSNKKVSKPPFQRIRYKDSMEKYGTDKPDLRNPLIIIDLTECFMDSGFKIFENNIKNGQVVKGIRAPKSSDKPRAWFDKLNNWARDHGQKGLGYIIFEGNEFKGPIANNLKNENLDLIRSKSNLVNGDSFSLFLNQRSKLQNFLL